MGTLRDHHSQRVFRGMLMGDPGSGKTGALAALIKRRAEFGIERFAILDWDDGLDILAALLDDDDKDAVYYETLRDDLKATQKGVDVAEANAFTRGMALLNNWKQKGDVNLGPARGWGPETVLVNDTITGLGDAAINFALVGEAAGDEWRAVGIGMRLQDKLVQMLVALNCHVLLNSHIRYMFGGGKKPVIAKDGRTIEYKEVDSRIDGEAYPSALGRNLPPTLGRHFNTILELKLVGKERRIRTVPEDRMNLKLPFKMQDELPQESGLAEIFNKFLNR